MTEFAVFFSSALFFSAAFDLVVNLGGRTFQAVNPLLLFAEGMISFALFRLLLRKERSGMAVLGTGAFCCLSGVVGLFFCLNPQGFSAWTVLLAGIVYECWQGYQLCMHSLAQTSLINRLDGVLALLIVTLIVQDVGNRVIATGPAWYAVGAGFCVAAAIANRIRSQNQAENSIAGTGRVSLVTALISAGAAGLAAVAARPLGKGFIAAINAIKAGLRWLGRMIGAFFLWLVSLFPVSEEGQLDIEATEGISFGAAAEQVTESDDLAVKILVVLIALGLAISLVFALRRAKLKRRKTRAVHSGRVRNRESLKSLLQRLGKSIRRRIDLFLGRNTVIGTYLNVEQLLSHSSLARKNGETVRSFLKRCEAQAGQKSPELAAMLRQLAEETDRCCYSGAATAKEHFAASSTVRHWAMRQRQPVHRQRRDRKSAEI